MGACSPASTSIPTRHRRLLLALCAAAAICAPVGALHAQEARPFAEFSRSAQALRDSVVQMARAQIGTRYRLGGQSPERGFDCSGLVKYVMSAFSVDVPRTARLQASEGVAVGRDTSWLLPGDILTFAKPKKGVSHVGIYVGNGRYVHASSVAGRVIESPINRPPSPLIKVWRGVRRFVTSSDIMVARSVTAPAPDGGNL